MTIAESARERRAGTKISRMFWRVHLVIAVAWLVSGCFLGYDSRWGQQKRAQQNFVKNEAPSTLRREASTPLNGAGAARTARLRVYATRAYSAEVLDWQRRFAKVLEGASAVMEPILGVQFQMLETGDWPLQNDDQNVNRLAGELRSLDKGEDVDWVVGLASATPRFETSFHELGVGELVGKHIVLRAITGAAEYQAIEEGLGELSEKERDKFRRERLAHKLTTVLLHEVGHTLGALHERNPKSIMNPAYSRETSGYSSDAIDVMRVVFAHRTLTGGVDESGRQSLVDILQRPSNPWVPLERDDALKRLTSVSANPATRQAALSAASPTAAPSMPAPSAAVAALSEADQRIYAQADALKNERKFEQALELARPLFDAYPSVEAVQDLRCQIASQRGMQWSSIEAECKAYMKLRQSPKSAAH